MTKQFSTHEAAKKLGVTILTLQRHLSRRSVDAPPLVIIGPVKMRLWMEQDIQEAVDFIPKPNPVEKRRQPGKTVEVHSAHEQNLSPADEIAQMVSARRPLRRLHRDGARKVLKWAHLACLVPVERAHRQRCPAYAKASAGMLCHFAN